MNGKDRLTKIEFIAKILGKDEKEVAEIILTDSGKQSQLKEQIFQKMGIVCGCIVGFSWCEPCVEYDNDIDKFIERHKQLKSFGLIQ